MKKMILLAAILAATLTLTAQTKPYCKGITMRGVACRSTIVKKSGYCIHHDPDTPRCAGKTTKGEPCKMPVKKEGELCRFHEPKN